MFNAKINNSNSFLQVQKKETEASLVGDERIIKSIVDELMPYDIFDVISRISSLNLLIENQNKSILFDALIAGILAQPRETYNGKAKISNGKFRSIITKLESMKLNWMIDPAENAFIERVMYYGNYWIFPGINYSPAYSLQGFLDSICLRNLHFDTAFIHKAHQLINFVLVVSDHAAHTLGYDINSIRHKMQTDIKYPDSKQIEKLAKCVVIPKSLIDTLIEDNELYQLLFMDFEEKDLKKVINIEFHDFYAHPFLQIDDNTVLLLNPAILVPFLIHHLVLLAISFGCWETLIDSYNDEIWKNCQHDLRKLGHKKILEDEYGITLINNSQRKEKILTVGNNKLLFVHFICDAGVGYDENTMFGLHNIKPPHPLPNDRYKYFVEKLPMAERKNVFQLVILNSFGRTITYDAMKMENDYTIGVTPRELHYISINERERGVHTTIY